MEAPMDLMSEERKSVRVYYGKGMVTGALTLKFCAAGKLWDAFRKRTLCFQWPLPLPNHHHRPSQQGRSVAVAKSDPSPAGALAASHSPHAPCAELLAKAEPEPMSDVHVRDAMPWHRMHSWHAPRSPEERRTASILVNEVNGLTW